MMEITTESIIAVTFGVVSGAYALGLRALQAENRGLRAEIDTFKRQHDKDLERLDDNHCEIWTEIKAQRESLLHNREAVIKLNASIDRLNEILPNLEKLIGSKVSKDQCLQFQDRRVNNDGPVKGRRWADDDGR
jgi:hypothetical protein